LTRSRLVAAVFAATTMVVPTAAAAQDFAPYYVVVGTGGGGLAVHSGPGADQPSLGILPEGAVVEIVDDRERDWFVVRGEALSGYCSAAFLTPLQVEASAPAARVISATVTGYANGSDGGAVGTTTASGTKTHWGTVAADWRLFPLGTRLEIEGFEDVIFVVEDSGSGVRGLLFDVWFPDVPAARAFGTQRRKVTILP
jgi:3D (Asp-Asp-Asp) domain-containing protein